ncbi:pentapeptide repeat-containing protein [Streptomyces sp. NPDC058653]|uniref:pentapeptide repeat-containing protein n=1 Tax=Streptomyces sp. NPDC058653 TaxID=3346576 RepID=UPI0036659054
MNDPEIQRQADALRGLLYLACSDAPPTAISDTARAIAERSGDRTPPTSAVAEAARLTTTHRSGSGPPHNLSRADLTGAKLTDTRLNHANLSSAKLSRADLSYASLLSADLTDADLDHAKLDHATLAQADLTDAGLAHANVERGNLTGANLTEARHLRLVSGILWNLDTTWPDGFLEMVYALSDEVRPGSYRLRGGTDRSSTLI